MQCQYQNWVNMRVDPGDSRVSTQQWRLVHHQRRRNTSQNRSFTEETPRWQIGEVSARNRGLENGHSQGKPRKGKAFTGQTGKCQFLLLSPNRQAGK